MEFTFGTDPEFILSDEKGKLKSAIGVVPGDKNNKFECDGDLFFHDNVLAECVVRPGSDPGELVCNLGDSLRSLAKIVAPLKITNLAAGNFEEDEMRDEEARKAGCAVEMCAYEMRTIPPGKIKKLFKKENFRTAGGHVHLGTGLGKDHEKCLMLVRMLDLFLGVPMLVIDDSPMTIERRKIYGRAGRYRQPDHGIEYRTPGNFWISSPRIVCLFFEICREVVKLTEERVYDDFWKVDHDTLNSDDFWNECGDPSKCHECHGYDVKLLRDAFGMERSEMKSKTKKILDVVFRYLPKKIRNEVMSLEGSKFDIYEEWNLTSGRASS
jgi:hypothetical protein